ncbi:hypothetical protein Tco_0662988 [Tanacetum coccineum]
MDLNAFIRTADPRKVRIIERARAENESPIVMVAKHHTMTLLPTSVDNAESVVPITDNVETEIPRPKHTKKKRVTRGSERTPAASHPPKRLSADYGTTGGFATRGKSPSVLNRLLQDSRLMVEQGVPTLPTLPFITSSVTASPLEEGGDHTDSVTGPSLRTVAASARENNSLLGVKDKEIEELRSQLLKAKEEFVEVNQLHARVSSLEAI